jgi:hypothetical protein
VIQFIVTKNCPECESDNIVKNGKDSKGDQKFHCHACGAYGTLDPTGRYTPERKEESSGLTRNVPREACEASVASLAWLARPWSVG